MMATQFADLPNLLPEATTSQSMQISHDDTHKMTDTHTGIDVGSYQDQQKPVTRTVPVTGACETLQVSPPAANRAPAALLGRHAGAANPSGRRRIMSRPPAEPMVASADGNAVLERAVQSAQPSPRPPFLAAARRGPAVP